MKILLVGYGKMGKAIEQIATQKGHEIVGRIDKDNASTISNFNAKNTDVAIEFTEPNSAFSNLKACLENEISVVSGTTGWYEKKDEMEKIRRENSGKLFTASNFSVGVNVFFKMNQFLANMMNNYTEYSVEMEEIHHTQKVDAPSGTAITLAEGILQHLSNKTEWSLKEEGKNVKNSAIPISAVREDKVPGTHEVVYKSEIDSIEIKHTAHSRQGFALGAVLAAEYLHKQQKAGIYGMDDLLGFK
jgi:4-hydroxy-tetrahydrodipicolinate reductase